MENEVDNNENEFRDSISTISKTTGKREWIYPKKPSGKFHNYRSIVAVILLLILFGLPLIKVNGQPLVLFNFIDRIFIFFGLSFGPYDFHIVVLVMIATIVFVVLFTAVYGRIFCGWACPQTIFMEMVFRKIEYWIDGDSKQQRELAAAPLSGKKLLKRTTKFFIFLGISYIISHTFMAYLIGIDKVMSVVSSPPSENWTGFVALNVFTGLFFFVFWWFREQACVIVCPYGRLQGVLLDQNSLVVAYDFIRGEPRGKINRNEIRTNGDCIDCKLCVDVCPTGIDIRNGIQLECVNCTACMDACDYVMNKIKKPEGLIRIDSLNGVREGKKFKFSLRLGLYSVFLTLLIIITSILIISRKDVEVNILRTPGMLYQDQPENKISNLYNFHLINKTFESIPVDFKIKNIDGEIKILGGDSKVDAQQVYEGKFMLVFNKDQLKTLNTKIDIAVLVNGKEIET
ncbi:MAG: cytochrome c oxidase accessory protein CcoG, partial [Ignavibacteriaceae bacterium]|nr:cytochrome c oxidase accessory protein CcoG [Ignavibacteriaceae bacterium]